MTARELRRAINLFLSGDADGADTGPAEATRAAVRSPSTLPS